MAIETRYSVISPESGTQRTITRQTAPTSIAMADRLDTLENKTVYLVDIGFGGGYEFMLQLQKWFAGHMPSVTTVLRRKPGHVFSDDDSSRPGNGHLGNRGRIPHRPQSGGSAR